MATVKVSFGELRTTGYYSNIRAEACIETDTEVPEYKIPELFEELREQVREQLDAEQRFRARKEKGCGGPAEDDEDEHEPDRCEGSDEYREPEPFSGESDDE